MAILRSVVIGAMYKTYVIIINGAPQSGKDTFVQLFKKICATAYDVFNLSSIDNINKIVMDHLGWDGTTKDKMYRNLIYQMKQFAIRNGDLPTKNLIERVYDIHKKINKNTFVFCHIREKEEIYKLYNALNGLYMFDIVVCSLYIRRDTAMSNGRKVGNSSDDYASSLSHSNKYDHIIDNNGSIEKLECHATSLRDELIGLDEFDL